MSRNQGGYSMGTQQYDGGRDEEGEEMVFGDDRQHQQRGMGDFHESTETQTLFSGDFSSLPEILQLSHLCSNTIVPRSDSEEDKLEADESWQPVRDWIHSHNTDEIRQAAEQRGESSVTALHYACRNRPPLDVINDFLANAIDTVQWPDEFGWLPLHYACWCGAETDVIKALAEAFPASKTTVDRNGQTPLHFALRNRNQEMLAPPAVVAILSSSGAASYPDANGMLPLHYACAHGASEESLYVLTNAYEEAISTRDRNDRTPLHFALSNAGRKTSPEAVRQLLELDKNLANANGGPLPLRVLADFAKHTQKRSSTTEDVDRESICKCLIFLLEASPRPTAGFFTALQSLPDWLSDRAVVMPSVQTLLNEKIAQRFPTAVLMSDFLALAIIIIFYSKSVTDSVKTRSKIEAGSSTEGAEIALLTLLPLYIGAGYFFLREVIQALSLWSLNAFRLWLVNASNWLNLVFIFLVVFWTVSMQTGYVELNVFRVGTALTVSILWLRVLGFLRNMLIDFAVFAGGVSHVLRRLGEYCSALAIILIAFAQMFETVFQEQCEFERKDRELWQVACEDGDAMPYCEFWTSLLNVYTMLLGEVNEEPFIGDTFATGLFIFFMFLVVILLANVLIAIVTESYRVIQDQRAAIVFWTNRLHFVAEMDAVANGPWKYRLRGLIGMQNNREDIDERTEVTFGREFWKRLMDLLFDDEIEEGASTAERWAHHLLRLITATMIVPAWLFVGLLTAGWIWPPQVRVYIFTSTVSKGNSEAQEKDEMRKTQVIKLQQEVAELKDEIGRMKLERTQLVQIKSLVSERRAEVANEMKHIKRIVAVLFEQHSGADS